MDAELCGTLSEGTHVITGGPGTGKTALALQIACTCRFPALFVSCEMSPPEICWRITARVTGTPLRKLKTGEIPPEIIKKLVSRAIANPSGHNTQDGKDWPQQDFAIVDATRGFASKQWIQEAAEIIKGDTSQVLVVIDSLHSWADSSQASPDEYERLGLCLAALRQLAAELHSPVLMISERNRQNRDRGGTSSGAGHRKIEYGAESQIDIDRVNAEWGYLRADDDEPEADPITGDTRLLLRLPKNRSGSAGKRIKLIFNGAFQSFREAKAGE